MKIVSLISVKDVEKEYGEKRCLMQNAREKGDLCHTEPISKQTEPQETPSDTFENRFYQHLIFK